MRIDDDIEISRPSRTQCPHEPVDADSQRCLFHSGTTKYPPDKFTDQFLTALDNEAIPPTFAGSRLNGLDLRGQTVTTASGRPIDLRGTVIDGDLDVTNATVEVPLILDQAAITGNFYADEATFNAPISLVDADIRGRVHWHDATVTGGVAAPSLDGGYVDAREITVDGPLLLNEARFASNVLLARATIAESVALGGAEFDYSLDATLLTVRGDFRLSEGSISADCDLIGADVAGDAEFRGLSVTGELDCSHATIDGNLVAAGSSFEGVAIFDDVTVRGAAVQVDDVQFQAKADFATMTAAVAEFSATNTTFAGEVWFTHAQIAGDAEFTGAVFDGMSHLRDATWKGDLSLSGIESTGQFFLHGSTIAGTLDCTDATFEHFQFSATINQAADFSQVEFVEKAIFRSSTFGDRTWFDNALFSGHPDFTDTRFTGKTTFDGTEFLVDPTFEDTRFAITPDLNAAEFPIDATAIAERREQMILVHPESLSHTGATLPDNVLAGDVSIPAETAPLLESDPETTQRIATALAAYDQRSWHDLCEDAIRTARTAVVEVAGDDDNTVLVFGLQLNNEAAAADTFIEAVSTTAVYCHTDSEIQFGHLDTTGVTADYLITTPAGDDAFESGAAVATTSELQVAAVRNEKFRAALLSKQAAAPPIEQHILPVLAGAARFD
jgi:hypothetical protein